MKLQNSPGSLVKTERPSLAIMLQYRSGAFDIWPHCNFVTFGLSNCRVIIMHLCLSLSCILGNFVRCEPWYLFRKVHTSVQWLSCMFVDYLTTLSTIHYIFMYNETDHLKIYYKLKFY